MIYMDNINHNQNTGPLKPRPITVEQKLDDIIKRLGRIEKHLIDIRDNIELPPGQPRYVIDRSQF